MEGSSSRPVILVLSLTGAGKANFISSAGPKRSVQPAKHKDISPSPAPVHVFEVEFKDGRTVKLVDMPEFNNKEKSDRMVLESIINFLKSRENDREVATMIFIVNSNKDYTPILLKNEYGKAYQQDHVGPSDQYHPVWRTICRALDTGGTGSSIQTAIRTLKGILQNLSQTEPEKPSGVGKGRRSNLFRDVLLSQQWRQWNLFSANFPSKDSLKNFPKDLAGTDADQTTKASVPKPETLHSEVQSMDAISLLSSTTGPNLSPANIPSKKSLRNLFKNLAGGDAEDATETSNPESDSIYSDVQSMDAISLLSSTAEPNYNPVAAALARQDSLCASFTTSSDSDSTEYGLDYRFRDLSIGNWIDEQEQSDDGGLHCV